MNGDCAVYRTIACCAGPAAKAAVAPDLPVVNALLWILALRGRHDPYSMATALFPVFVFVLATGVASVAPMAAQFIWCLAFLSPFAGWVAARASAKPSPRRP